MYLLGATEPDGKRTGYAEGQKSEHDRKDSGGHNTLTEHLAGLTEIIGSDKMGHLNGKPIATAPVSAPKSHIVLSTRPIAADGSAPREPTMAASI